MKKFYLGAILVTFTLFLSACGMTNTDIDRLGDDSESVDTIQNPSVCDAQTEPNILSWDTAPSMSINQSKTYNALFKTNFGEFKIQLFANKAPKTVNNFVFLAKEGFYDCVTFHRVIAGFMIQGGDPLGLGVGDPGYKFDDEFVSGLSNTKGSIAMANSGPNTNGSQFFINLEDNTGLDFDKEPLTSGHAVFGEVVEGMDIVETIGKLRTNAQDKPSQNVYIESIEIIEE